MDVVAYNKLILLLVLCSIYLEASILPRNKRQTSNQQLPEISIKNGTIDQVESPLSQLTNPTPVPTIIPSHKAIIEYSPLEIQNNLYAPSSTCARSITVTSGRTKFCSGDLIFKEEFNKNSLGDLKNWEKEIKIPREPDFPFNVYMKSSLSIENGKLSIFPLLTAKEFSEGFLFKEMDLGILQTSRSQGVKPLVKVSLPATSSSDRNTSTESADTIEVRLKKEALDCTGLTGTKECYHISRSADILPPVITGKVNTRNSFFFKYGRIEIRAKLPGGDWIIPEINLEPRDKIYGNSKYESGLMRIAFAKGNAIYSKDLYGGPILSDKDPFRTSLLKRKHGIENWNNDFHNYTMIWNIDRLEFYVDGEYYGAVDPGEGFRSSAKKYSVQHAELWDTRSPAAPLDQLFYISLGLRVGGINDFPDNKQKPWKNSSFKAKLNFWEARNRWLPSWKDSEMQIDYVRVYAL